MSNLALRTVYSLLNAYPEIVCERACGTSRPALTTSIRSHESYRMQSQRPLE